MTDELDTPLGRKPKRFAFSLPRMDGGGWPIARLTFGAVVLILGAAVLRVALVKDPLGGRPSATVDISATKNTNSVAQKVATPPKTDTAPSHGTTGQGDGPQITVLDGPDANAAGPAVPQVAVSTLNAFGVDPDLVEETKDGPIPHVAADGRTPFEVYGRAPVTDQPLAGRPEVAIVVTGLGLNESVTLDAIDRLPENVTLAFAPYGKTLRRTTAAARAAGHEMLLQVPLEPFDYPDSDPGPKTLLVDQPPRANLDKLYWLMSRFGGYLGVTNYMGAQFTASAGDFSPVMEEFGTRGLGYLDDGSSNRSVAKQLAERNKVPFARASIDLDVNPSRSAILKKLEALDAEAKAKGSALGVISALPVSITTVAEWAKGLEKKGLVLVPASALMKVQQD